MFAIYVETWHGIQGKERFRFFETWMPERGSNSRSRIFQTGCAPSSNLNRFSFYARLIREYLVE